MGPVELLACAALMYMLACGIELRQLRRELTRLSERIETIREKLGIVEKPQISPEIAALLQVGRKIEAIKVYREETGAGLVDAKDAVERMMKRVATTSDSPN